MAPDDRQWAQLWRLGAGQYGVFHVRQAAAIGISRSTLDARAAREALRRPQPSVIAVPGARVTLELRVSAALLSAGPGALASHGTAAALWGFGEAQPAVIDLLLPIARHLRALRGVKVRRSSTLLPRDAGIVASLPATVADRTVCDLARYCDEDTLMERAATAIQNDLTTLRGIAVRRAALPRLAGGPRLDRALARLSGMGRTDSPLERELRQLLCAAGLAPHPGTYMVRLPNGRRAEVDIPYPTERLALEVDSRDHHFRLPDLYRDDERRNELAEAGWVLLHFRKRDIRDRPGYIIDKVRALLARGRMRR